ncbi:MAG: D-alanine--D-alanine ligase [bacterium]|nr:D-alanine--D-alanine ligase [bacterium]
MAKKKLRVALIFGGTSPEREVSLHSVKTVLRHFDSQKYDVIPVEISKEGKWLLTSPTIKQIAKEIPIKRATSKELVPIEKNAVRKIDVAFLVLHGPGGEDGTIQGMLDLLRISYTCSGVLASAVAMDKLRTKLMVASLDVLTPPDILISKHDWKSNAKLIIKKLRGKFVVKPNQIGSSLGVTIVKEKRNIKKAFDKAFELDDEVLVEPFIEGREITIGTLGNKNPVVLPAAEILPLTNKDFWDFAAKYEEGKADHLIPAPLTAAQTEKVSKLAYLVHTALGCRGITRSDFILDKKGRFWFLEINTIPGLTPVSLVPQMAAKAGISFPKLLEKLIKLAREK